jgi:hypothetical protein
MLASIEHSAERVSAGPAGAARSPRGGSEERRRGS